MRLDDVSRQRDIGTLAPADREERAGRFRRGTGCRDDEDRPRGCGEKLSRPASIERRTQTPWYEMPHAARPSLASAGLES